MFKAMLALIFVTYSCNAYAGSILVNGKYQPPMDLDALLSASDNLNDAQLGEFLSKPESYLSLALYIGDKVRILREAAASVLTKGLQKGPASREALRAAMIQRSPYDLEKMPERYISIVSNLNMIQPISQALSSLILEYKGPEMANVHGMIQNVAPTFLARVWTRHLEEKISALPAEQRSQWIKELIGVFNSPLESHLRGAVLVALAPFSHPDVYPLIEKNWNTKDGALASSVGHAMSRSPDPRSLTFVVKYINQEAKTGDGQGNWNEINLRFKKLQAALSDGGSENATTKQKAIARALKPLILKWLESSNPKVRANAALLVEHAVFTREEAAEIVAKILRDADARVRYAGPHLLRGKIRFNDQGLNLIGQILATESDKNNREDVEALVGDFNYFQRSCGHLLMPRSSW